MRHFYIISLTDVISTDTGQNSFVMKFINSVMKN